ncbi:MAG TPA: protein-L-isoaspartate(D-aspartate) O-methyltransferase [Bryobacteraceae bacterium]|nr:protein-L-isoaspartate(D-aspartate) O-methyltransferase [Bryobacteraceae bacterium]
MRTQLVAFLLTAALLPAQDPFRSDRDRMVQNQIAARGIKNASVLKAMRETPRHMFMPVDVRSAAYEDRPVSIGHGQTISQPYIVAFMTEALDVAKDHRVLEIGTGSAYQAAILSRLAHEVYTIEIVDSLARSATETLKQMGYKNVFVRDGDGYRGWPEKAPFDRIILTAAPPELPEALVQQLKPGGKMLAPVGRSTFEQELLLLTKDSDGKISTQSILPVRFVPMVKPQTR